MNHIPHSDAAIRDNATSDAWCADRQAEWDEGRKITSDDYSPFPPPPPPKPPEHTCQERFDIDLASGGKCFMVVDRATNEYREFAADFWGGVALGVWKTKRIYQIGS